MAGLDLAHEAEGGDPPLPPPNLPFLKLESMEMIDLTINIIIIPMMWIKKCNHLIHPSLHYYLNRRIMKTKEAHELNGAHTHQEDRFTCSIKRLNV